MYDSEDDLINGAFDEFSATASPSVKIAGTAAVRATVRHRRRVRVTALSVLGALLIAVPTATYAVNSHSSKSPPIVAATSTTVTVSAAPTPTDTLVPPTAAPSASPSRGTSPSSSKPSSGKSSPPTEPAGHGKITIGQLTAGKVSIPAWNEPAQIRSICPAGKVKLVKPSSGSVNRYPNPPHTLFIAKVAYTNLDGDAAQETAALVVCQVGENAVDKVIGFDRNAAGQVMTLGTVAEGVIWSVSPRSSGGITTDVSDFEPCCSTPGLEAIHQDRSYAWTGSHYAQVGGPTSFISHSKPITFKVTTASSTWSAVKNDTRTGTVTVTITNESSVTSNSLLVWDNSGDTDVGSAGPALKLVHGLRPGASEQVKLVITLPAEATGCGANCSVGVYEQGSQLLGASATEKEYTIWS